MGRLQPMRPQRISSSTRSYCVYSPAIESRSARVLASAWLAELDGGLSSLDGERQPFSFEAATHPAKRRVYATNGGRRGRALKRVGDNKTTP